MYFNCFIEIPEDKGKITVNRRGDTTYIEYTYDREYVPDKKYTVPKRTTIGKKSKEDSKMMQPNPNFYKYYPDYELPLEENNSKRESTIKIGNFIVIKKIIEDYGIDKMIETIIGKDYGLFMDFIAYSIICEDNVAQYYPYYTYNHLLFTEKMHMYSDSKISSFINSIKTNQSVSFLNQWNGKRDHKERIYISYDSTSKISGAGDIDIIEYGHSKNGNNEPIFNYSIAYDCMNKEPLFYEEYPGSIVDVSQLQYMLEKAKGYDYKNIGFILDRGYFSRQNINYMDKCGYNFVIMIKGMKKLVREIVLENKGKFEEKREYSIRQFQTSGMTIKRQLFSSDEKDRYIHIYYNGKKYAEEREIFEKNIDKYANYLKVLNGKSKKIEGSFKKYFDLIYHSKDGEEIFMYGRELTEATNEEIKLCGYFVIVTSEEMTAKEALTLYKSRDESEKLFRSDKTFLNNCAMRVHSEESLEAKTFIEFVALIVKNKMFRYLKDYQEVNDKKSNYMTVPSAIHELEKISLRRHIDNHYSLDHALTATQKEILKAFDINTFKMKEYIKKYAGQLYSLERTS